MTSWLFQDAAQDGESSVDMPEFWVNEGLCNACQKHTFKFFQ